MRVAPTEGVSYDNMAADGGLKDRGTVTVDYCVAQPEDESFVLLDCLY